MDNQTNIVHQETLGPEAKALKKDIPGISGVCLLDPIYGQSQFNAQSPSQTRSHGTPPFDPYAPIEYRNSYCNAFISKKKHTKFVHVDIKLANMSQMTSGEQNPTQSSAN